MYSYYIISHISFIANYCICMHTKYVKVFYGIKIIFIINNKLLPIIY